MAKTLQTMVTRIASEIRRPVLATPSDLTSPIAVAILTAVEEWQKDRFRISDIDPTVPTSFNTVVGRSVYTVSDNPNISTIYVIDYLNVFVGSTVEKMTRRTPESILLLLQQNQQSGQPTDYAYQGNKIIIYPIPSSIWQIFIGGHVQIAAPASLVEDNNPWMNWAEQLIRCQAKYEIATHITRNPTMAQAMSPDSDGGPNGQPGETWRALARLKKETNKIKSVGRTRSMQW
jgi:hypothetical protein